jgi:hypothetical protein
MRENGNKNTKQNKDDNCGSENNYNDGEIVIGNEKKNLGYKSYIENKNKKQNIDDNRGSKSSYVEENNDDNGESAISNLENCFSDKSESENKNKNKNIDKDEKSESFKLIKNVGRYCVNESNDVCESESENEARNKDGDVCVNAGKIDSFNLNFHVEFSKSNRTQCSLCTDRIVMVIRILNEFNIFCCEFQNTIKINQLKIHKNGSSIIKKYHVMCFQNEKFPFKFDK